MIINMTEIIGVISSVLALCETVKGGLTIAKTLYEAPNEILMLQKTVEVLSSAASDLERVVGQSLPTPFGPSLHHARDTLESLDNVISTKLLRNSRNKENTRPKRIGWLLNKANVVKHTNLVQSAVQAIQLTASTELLQFNRQIQLSLGRIERHMMQIPLPTTQTRESITSAMIRICGPRPQSPSFQQRTKASTEVFTPQLCQTEELGDSRGSVASATSRWKNTRSRGGKPSKAPFDQTSGISVASPFELLDSFFPEQYISEAHFALSVHKLYQTTVDPFSRSIEFEIGYSKLARECISVSLSLTITLESPFWDLGQFCPSSPKTRRRPQVSPAIVGLLQCCFEHVDTIRHNDQIVAYAGRSVRSQQRPLVSERGNTAKQQLESATQTLRHLGVPWYPENHVLTPRSYATTVGRNREFSKIGPVWAAHHRFTSNMGENEELLYLLRSLHSLKGAHGIQKLIGSVNDNETGVVKGFLVEAPACRQLLHFVRGTQASISWERCEKWCYQLIQAVA
ncbi:hypothetical protein F5Y16DRAFT_119209 [Xylariaceae sp. FL0255]|nr:hypothetical protein F5Y16DRAFT_119209 [Xylariaceae sp. FL0255]